GWRNNFDYSGGKLTDWGVHLIDMALWAKDITTAPASVLAYGDNLSFPDHSRETYDTMSVTFPMKDYVINWQHTAGTQNGPYDMLYGMEFIGDYGTIVANRSGWKVNPEFDNDTKSYKTETKELEKGREYHDLHAKNFIECIKSREEPNCPPEIGRNVALYAHMGNIAVRSGAGLLEWDDTRKRFNNNEDANNFIIPEYRKPWELPKL
ncbi:MAG: Gfo/Idh/MocA family protein, partial [Cyclobacteriaceae bacterium]